VSELFGEMLCLTGIITEIYYIYVIVVVNDIVCMYMLQLPIMTLREIDILHYLKHDSVVSLIEVCRSRGLRIFYSSN
jgi:hypothetical protein